jgi:hypothetical protein
MEHLVSARKIRCREIAGRDIGAIADLLTRGFPHRSWDYWLSGLQRQAERAVPESYPRYGYLLEAGGDAVGCILLMFSEKADQQAITCNVASWYVEKEFRSHASLLTAMALKHRHVTYVNVTPSPPTWPIVEAQGFQRYCRGLYFSLPALSRTGAASITMIATSSAKPDDLSDSDFKLLTRHAGYGCLSLICRVPEREPLPFVFASFRMRQGRIPMPAVQLAYCRDVKDFVACAGAIGRFLLRRGKPLVIVDSNAPIAGLAGFYSEARGRKYFRGPNPPRLADLTETELVLYGI